MNPRCFEWFENFMENVSKYSTKFQSHSAHMGKAGVCLQWFVGDLFGTPGGTQVDGEMMIPRWVEWGKKNSPPSRVFFYRQWRHDFGWNTCGCVSQVRTTSYEPKQKEGEKVKVSEEAQLFPKDCGRVTSHWEFSKNFKILGWQLSILMF